MALSYRSRKILRFLLPIVIWLLAAGVLALLTKEGLMSWRELVYGFIAAFGSWGSVLVIEQVDRHQYNATEEAFLSAFLVASSSFFCPWLIIWEAVPLVILALRKSLDLRAVSASLIGLIGTAFVLLPVLYFCSIPLPWLSMMESETLWPLVAVGLFWLSYIASTISRKNLRER